MPEVNLDNLIRQLKEEGVEKANLEGAEIIARAKKEAETIVSAAQSRAQQITDKAVRESEKLKQSAVADIKQAGRDIVLLVKQELMDIAQRAYAGSVSSALSTQVISDIIVRIASNWAPDKALTAYVSKDEQQALASLLPSAMRSIGRQVEIKTDSNLAKGFRIMVDGESVAYDFSDEAIAASINELVADNLKNILKNG